MIGTLEWTGTQKPRYKVESLIRASLKDCGMDKSEVVRLLVLLLQDKADFALLFGSYAKGDDFVRSDSDIDCAAFFHPEFVTDYSYLEIAEEFQLAHGRKLDLICLNTADIIIATQVVVTGEILFASSKEQLHRYHSQVLSRYIDFKRSRKIIEDNILVRPTYAM